MLSKIAYPWFFFYRVARLAVLFFLPTFFMMIYLFRNAHLEGADPVEFADLIVLKIIPLGALSMILFLYSFYRSSRPLGNVLAKVRNFNVEISFDKNLQLFYKQDEWARIEEALNEADSTLKKQVEQVRIENEKIGAILESINDDIIAIDQFETVLFFNPNFRLNFMRQQSGKELILKVWHIFDEEELLHGFKKVLKTGEKILLPGQIFRSSNRPDRWFDLTITPLRNSAGKITGALGVFYDVTEFKLTEQMRVDFVANVSHEIRTPLTSIKGFTQVLESQRSKVDSSLHGFLEKIVSNTERMISLFNDLLNLSVIESQNSLRFEELVLQDLVDEVTSGIAANYVEKKVMVETDLRLASIKGDHRLMEQVFSNLIDNAFKYSGKGRLVKISSLTHEGKARLIVSDKGPGISKEHLQRIFERFYRVDTSREASRGTGLGLSIVKHIIAKHSGNIWAESTEEGTAFIIELPLT